MGTESWLDDTVSDAEVFPAGFTVYRKDRHRHGGGVFLLISNRWTSHELVFENATESVWCRVFFPRGTALVFGTFYRPPDNSETSICLLCDMLSMIPDSVFLGGDFNLPDFNWSTGTTECIVKSRVNTVFTEVLGTFGFNQYVQQPTRLNAILDLVLCNDPNIVAQVGVYPGISDHSVVVATLNVSGAPERAQLPRKVFMYERGNFDAIGTELDSYFSTFLCLAESHCLEDLWSIFRNKITNLIDTFVPSRIIRQKRKQKPWFNIEIRKLVRRARCAYRRVSRDGCPINLQRLKEINYTLKLSIRKAKKLFFSRLNDDLKRNPKVFWNYVKTSRKDDISIPYLNVNNTIIKSDAEKAECFNSYFKSVFSQETTSDESPVSVISGNTMADIEIDVNGITCLLREMNTSKATGPDGLPSIVLCKCRDIIAQYLCLMFKISLETGAVPHDWKVANVIPVFKSGDKKLVENYRPISLTSISCKLLEHIIYSEVFDYLESCKFLAPSQHGFRRGCSCNTQLAEFQHYISKSLDSNTNVDAIFLDFRKAFDTVPHHLLLKKLASLNITNNIQKWIKNYLSGREQCVVLNGSKSLPITVSSGVPQGSVLGPLLFLIYINDIVTDIQSPIKLFADDCVVYRQIYSTMDIEILQSDLDKIEHWCDKWKMSLNIGKCNYLSFTKNVSRSPASYTIKNAIIRRVSDCKYLGVNFTQSLKWHNHIDYTIAKASKMLYFIRRNFKGASTEVKETLYILHVRSILDYACIIWDPYQDYLIEKLEKVQNQAARFVSNNYNPYASISEIKAMLGWESLNTRRYKLRLKFFHRIYYNETGIDRNEYLYKPSYMSARFDNSEKVFEYCYKTNNFGSSFFVQTIKDWNLLQQELVSISDNDVFFSCL